MKKVIFLFLCTGLTAGYSNVQAAEAAFQILTDSSDVSSSDGLLSCNDSRLSSPLGESSIDSNCSSPKDLWSEGLVSILKTVLLKNLTETRREMTEKEEFEAAKWELFKLCNKPAAFECSKWCFCSSNRVKANFKQVHSLLAKYPALFSARDAASQQSQTILHAAVRAGNIKLVELFKDKFLAKDKPVDFDPHARDMNGRTPLYHAVAWGDEAMISLVLEMGVDGQAKDLGPLLACALSREGASKARIINQLLGAWNALRKMPGICDTVCDTRKNTLLHNIAYRITQARADEEELLLVLYSLASILVNQCHADITLENMEVKDWAMNETTKRVALLRGQTASDIILSSKNSDIIRLWCVISPSLSEQIEAIQKAMPAMKEQQSQKGDILTRLRKEEDQREKELYARVQLPEVQYVCSAAAGKADGVRP